jgi:hypothetical protein
MNTTSIGIAAAGRKTSKLETNFNIIHGTEVADSACV